MPPSLKAAQDVMAGYPSMIASVLANTTVAGSTQADQNICLTALGGFNVRQMTSVYQKLARDPQSVIVAQ